MRSMSVPLAAFLLSSCVLDEQALNEAGAVVVPCAVAAGACAIPVIATVGPRISAPESVPGFGTRMRDCPYDPADVAALLTAFIEASDALLGNGDRLRQVVDRLDIFWKEGRYFHVWNVTASGSLTTIGANEYWRRGRADIAWMMDVPLGRTALAHELTHATLAVKFGDYDSNHLEPPGPWTIEVHRALIDDVNRLFMDTMPVR